MRRVGQKRRNQIKKPFFAFLLVAFLSSCQAGGSSLLESYEPSDDFKSDWDSIKAFNRWIDPRVGAFLLMEESCLDINKFELEEEGTNLEGEVIGRLYRSKVYSDLIVVTKSLNSENQKIVYFDAPSRYVMSIYWRNDNLTFLGCRYSDGPEVFGTACQERLDELPVGQDSDPHHAWFRSGESSAMVSYICVPVKYKPVREQWPTGNPFLFSLSCWWWPLELDSRLLPYGFRVGANETIYTSPVE